MGKCIRCGKESFLFKNFELKDGEICKKCFRALGFDKSYDLITEVYSYEEIKDGVDEMYRKKNEEKKKEPSGLIFANYGQERELDSEPEEREIFNILCSLFADLGRDSKEVKLVRVSDDYVTAKLGEWDLARFHWGPRSKWILFPTLERLDMKHKIKTPEEVEQFSELLQKSVEHIAKYS